MHELVTDERTIAGPVMAMFPFNSSGEGEGEVEVAVEGEGGGGPGVGGVVEAEKTGEGGEA